MGLRAWVMVFYLNPRAQCETLCGPRPSGAVMIKDLLAKYDVPAPRHFLSHQFPIGRPIHGGSVDSAFARDFTGKVRGLVVVFAYSIL